MKVKHITEILERGLFITPNLCLFRCTIFILQPFLHSWYEIDSREELVRAIEISRPRHVDLYNVLDSGLLPGPGFSQLHLIHPFNHPLDIQEFGISDTKICYFLSLHETWRDIKSLNKSLLQWIQYNRRLEARRDSFRWCSK